MGLGGTFRGVQEEALDAGVLDSPETTELQPKPLAALKQRDPVGREGGQNKCAGGAQAEHDCSAVVSSCLLCAGCSGDPWAGAAMGPGARQAHQSKPRLQGPLPCLVRTPKPLPTRTRQVCACSYPSPHGASICPGQTPRAPQHPLAAVDPWIPAATTAPLGQPGASSTSPPSTPFIKFLQPSLLACLGPLPGWTGVENVAGCPQPTCPLCPGAAGSWHPTTSACNLPSTLAPSAACKPTGNGCPGHEEVQASRQCIALLKQHGECLQIASPRGVMKHQSNPCACCSAVAVLPGLLSAQGSGRHCLGTPSACSLSQTHGVAKPAWHGLSWGQGTPCMDLASLCPGLWPMGTSKSHGLGIL